MLSLQILFMWLESMRTASRKVQFLTALSSFPAHLSNYITWQPHRHQFCFTHRGYNYEQHYFEKFIIFKLEASMSKN